MTTTNERLATRGDDLISIGPDNVLHVPTGLRFRNGDHAIPHFIAIESDCPFLNVLQKNQEDASFDIHNPTESTVNFNWRAHHLHSEEREPIGTYTPIVTSSIIPPPPLCQLPGGGGEATDALDFGLWLGKTRDEVGHADDLSDTELVENVAPWRFFDIALPGTTSDIYRYFAGTLIDVLDGSLSWSQKGEWPPGMFLEAPPLFDVKVDIEPLSSFDQSHQYLPFLGWLWSNKNFGLIMMIEPDATPYVSKIHFYRMYWGAFYLMATVDFAGLNYSTLKYRMTRDVEWNATLQLYVRRWRWAYQDPLSSAWITLHTVYEDPKQALIGNVRVESLELHNRDYEPQLPFLQSTINLGVSASMETFNGDGFARFYDFEFVYPAESY